jgi:hypothetical protein
VDEGGLSVFGFFWAFTRGWYLALVGDDLLVLKKS